MPSPDKSHLAYCPLDFYPRCTIPINNYSQTYYYLADCTHQTLTSHQHFKSVSFINLRKLRDFSKTGILYQVVNFFLTSLPNWVCAVQKLIYVSAKLIFQCFFKFDFLENSSTLPLPITRPNLFMIHQIFQTFLFVWLFTSLGTTSIPNLSRKTSIWSFGWVGR